MTAPTIGGKARGGKFVEVDHPRDGRGRFIEVGGRVSLFGGGRGEVLRAVGHGRIEVRRDDGQTVQIDAGLTTIIGKPRQPGAVDVGPTAARSTAASSFQRADTPAAPEVPPAPAQSPVAALFPPGEDARDAARFARADAAAAVLDGADTDHALLYPPARRAALAQIVLAPEGDGYRSVFLADDGTVPPGVGTTYPLDAPEVADYVRDLAGAQVLNRWVVDDPYSPEREHLNAAAARAFTPDAPARDTDDPDGVSALADALTRMRARTGADLREAGAGDTVRVYRPAAYDPSGAEPGDLSSGTLDRAVAAAADPDGDVVAVDVPIDQVLSTARTGFGSHERREAVLLPDDARVWGPEPVANPDGSYPAPGASPDGADVALTQGDGPGRAWYGFDADGAGTGYLQTDRDDPGTVSRFADQQQWAAAVDALGMTEDDGAPAAEPITPTIPTPAPVPAARDQVEAMLVDGLGIDRVRFSRQSGMTPGDRDTGDAASRAKAEVVADLTRRMADVPDADLLDDTALARLRPPPAGYVRVQAPILGADGEPLNNGATERRDVPSDAWDKASAAGTIPPGAVLVDPEQDRNAERAAAVNSLVGGWAFTSNGLSARSLAVQQRANDLFGLDGAEGWPPLDNDADNGGFPSVQRETQAYLDRHANAIDAFLLAQYGATQERFAAAGITHVEVHRGVVVDRWADTPGWARNAEPDAPAPTDGFTARPLSSWSLDRSTAAQFATDRDAPEGYVVTQTVPVTSILATPRSGVGALDEAEMVVLHEPGRPSTVSVVPAGSAANAPEPPAQPPAVPDPEVEFAEHQVALEALLVGMVDEGRTTADLHRDDDGNWTPERQALHDEIIAAVLASNAGVKRERKAIMAGGLPGGGKTTVLQQFAGIPLDDYLTINADDFKELLAARPGALEETDGIAPMEQAMLMHEESSYLAKKVAALAYDDGMNVIWDMTMGSRAAADKKIEELDRSGYEVEGIYVSISIPESQRRAASRYRNGYDLYKRGEGLGGRFIPASLGGNQQDPDAPAGVAINERIFKDNLPRFSKASVWDNGINGAPAVLISDSRDAEGVDLAALNAISVGELTGQDLRRAIQNASSPSRQRELAARANALGLDRLIPSGWGIPPADDGPTFAGLNAPPNPGPKKGVR